MPCRQQSVSRNFTLSLLKPACYRRKRKKSSNVGRAPTEVAGLPPHHACLMELGVGLRMAALLSRTLPASHARMCFHARAQAHKAPLVGWAFAPSSLRGGGQRSTSELLVAFGNGRSCFVFPFLLSPWRRAFCVFPFAVFLSVFGASFPPQQVPFLCCLPKA